MSLMPFLATLAIGAWWLGARGPSTRKRHIVGLLATLTLLGVTVATLPHPAMLDKLLTRIALPVGLLWLAGFGVIVACLRAGDRRLAGLALAGWLVYTAAGNVWLGGALLAGLERDVPPLSAFDPALRLDVIMILGGGTALGSDGRPQLGANGDRLRVASAAWRRGYAPLLVASGTGVAGLDQADRRDLGAETRALLDDMGVAADALLTLPGPYNTATEISALAERAAAEGWTRIGLITSAWHMPRALRLAHAAGLDPVPIGADYRGHVPPPSALGLVPTGSGQYRIQIALKEHLAAVVGR